MARKMVEVLACDICETDRKVTAVTIDGRQLDLCARHRQPITALLGRLRTAAATPAAKPEGAGKSEPIGIREWARAHGYEVADKGKIARHIADEYQAAHQSAQVVTVPFRAPAMAGSRNGGSIDS